MTSAEIMGCMVHPVASCLSCVCLQSSAVRAWPLLLSPYLLFGRQVATSTTTIVCATSYTLAVKLSGSPRVANPAKVVWGPASPPGCAPKICGNSYPCPVAGVITHWLRDRRRRYLKVTLPISKGLSALRLLLWLVQAFRLGRPNPFHPHSISLRRSTQIGTVLSKPTRFSSPLLQYGSKTTTVDCDSNSNPVLTDAVVIVGTSASSTSFSLSTR